MLDHFAEWAWTAGDYCRPAGERILAGAKGVGTAAFLAFGGQVAGKLIGKVVGRIGAKFAGEAGGAIENSVLKAPRVGSALKNDMVKPIRDAFNNIVKEFPNVAKGHGFPDMIDNYAGMAQKFQLRSGAQLYQLEGALNGVSGRFEWIIDAGNVTHRMFVESGVVNGVPIIP